MTENTATHFESLVDGLVQYGYAVADHFLSPPEVALLRQEADRMFGTGAFSPAGVGKGDDYQRNLTVRGDLIRWVDRSNLPPSCHFFPERMEAFIQYVNQTCYLGIREAEMHFAVYPAGTFYKRHLDVFRKVQSRKLSVICYLNDDWTSEEGGQLRMYVPQEDGTETTVDILPVAGRLVCFRSEIFEHEVLPANRPRYSLTGWLVDDRPLI